MREKNRDEKVEKKRKDKRGIRVRETKTEGEENSLLPSIHYIHAYILTWDTPQHCDTHHLLLYHLIITKSHTPLPLLLTT